MKTLQILIIGIFVFSTLLYIKPVQADNESGAVIENIQTLPTSIIIGQTFKINATLANNSTHPIFIEHGSCGSPFSVTFDNHVVVRTNNVTCTLQLIEQRLDPGTKITSTSPYLDLTYVAAQNGTVNATVSFPYNVWNQTAQSNTQENTSKQFSFMIYPKTRVPTLSPSGNQAIIDVALSIPDLQKWSNDWQFDSMAFMTAKNQPGNWQYAIVYLKASSSSSIIPCDSNNDWSAMVMIDRTTMKVIQATYPTVESHNCNYATGGGPTGGGPNTYGDTTPKMDTPLQQFKSGVSPLNVKCSTNYALIIKKEDGSPACVKTNTAKKLMERGWTRDPSIKLPILSIQNQTRIPDYVNKQNISSLFTALSSTVFPTTTMESFDGMSVKGYLTNQNGTGLANQEIMFYLNNATFDNGTTISENLLMGNTTTDQTGCFYFADWDANKSLQFHNEVFTTSPSGNGLFSGSDNVLVYINTIFAGTNNLSGSLNATKIMYHPIVPPIIREAGINAYLMNASSYFPHYSAVPILEAERGKSYNFIAFSSWSESLNVQTFRLEIKNLPCWINVPPVDVSDLKNKTQAVIPVKMIIDKTAPSGSFFLYVSVNNHVTQPLDLVVK